MRRKSLSVFCPGPAQTLILGSRLGKILRGGDVALLSGDLGSGKTALAQGIARGLGFLGYVSSPTFALIQSYRAGRWTMHHMDLYRITAEEAGDIGLEECLGDPRGFCVIEWPEAGKNYYPDDGLLISIRQRGRGRLFGLKAIGQRGLQIISRLRS
ncbi:MAG: tRNA (adenosine(37)-N6)-threonylcarbamoyltransferase complex ATPase subunit type 1 TsaE [Elusimicrobiota bacterium]